MMEKIALFPGSFDPFTLGHESVVKRALPLFDKIIIAIGYNSEKDGFFALDERMSWIVKVFEGVKKIGIEKYQGLTVDFCRKVGARYILRGLRTSSDFEYERTIAQMNKVMYPEIETIFLLTLPEHTHINSTIVREIIRLGGDAHAFLPEKIKL
ncbi:MAG TPA: pantetheine-phosphate adenylyltransferase [Bacteroidales bacterium]|nr:pantetheine-phosphate adenylyltransferase [Bacteroidales bacterium]